MKIQDPYAHAFQEQVAARLIPCDLCDAESGEGCRLAFHRPACFSRLEMVRRPRDVELADLFADEPTTWDLLTEPIDAEFRR